MTVYRYTKDSIIPLANATFSSLKIGERDDLQRLLRDKIEIIAPDTLVIAEEFCAISNQWGPRTMVAIEKMVAHCPTLKIHCEPMA